MAGSARLNIDYVRLGLDDVRLKARLRKLDGVSQMASTQANIRRLSQQEEGLLKGGWTKSTTRTRDTLTDQHDA